MSSNTKLSIPKPSVRLKEEVFLLNPIRHDPNITGPSPFQVSSFSKSNTEPLSASLKNALREEVHCISLDKQPLRARSAISDTPSKLIGSSAFRQKAFSKMLKDSPEKFLMFLISISPDKKCGEEDLTSLIFGKVLFSILMPVTFSPIFKLVIFGNVSLIPRRLYSEALSSVSVLLFLLGLTSVIALILLFSMLRLSSFPIVTFLSVL